MEEMSITTHAQVHNPLATKSKDIRRDKMLEKNVKRMIFKVINEF
jgi:hypothetical protein